MPPSAPLTLASLRSVLNVKLIKIIYLLDNHVAANRPLNVYSKVLQNSFGTLSVLFKLSHPMVDFHGKSVNFNFLFFDLIIFRSEFCFQAPYARISISLARNSDSQQKKGLDI